MPTLRIRTVPLLLVASFLTMAGGSLAAASPHEVCAAMHHSCEPSEELGACCCGDRAEITPSTTPSDAGGLVTNPAPHVTNLGPVAIQPPVLATIERDAALARSGPRDLSVLFRDLRR